MGESGRSEQGLTPLARAVSTLLKTERQGPG